MPEFLRWQVVERCDDATPGHRRLHMGGNTAARGHERLKLVPDPDEGVGHRHNDFALEIVLELLGHCRRRVPRCGDDDEIRLGGGCVVTEGQRVGQFWVEVDIVIAGFHRAVLRAGADHDPKADTGETGRECATGRATSADHPNEPGAVDVFARHPGIIAHRLPPDITRATVRAMGILDGKKLVITGVLTDASLAFGVAKLAIAEGAEIVLTGAGRAITLTQRTARKLDPVPPVFEFDVTVAEHVDSVREQVREALGHVDGVLHAIGFAPASCLGDDFFGAPWEDVATAMHISTYSLKTLADAFVPLMHDGGSIVGLDFDNSQAWPAYNWMGVAKSALQSLSRYLAKELGPKQIRCNLVAAGPIRTMAAKSIPGFALFEDTWDGRSPLGWDVHDSEPVARACVAMLSDWFPKTTGEVVHVDGGYHAVGA